MVLSFRSKERVLTPIRLPDFEMYKVVRIAAGANHSVIVVEDKEAKSDKVLTIVCPHIRTLLLFHES